MRRNLVPEIKIVVLPRYAVKSKRDFLKRFPRNAIALDGVIQSGPFFDLKRLVFNFDHHNGVIREISMCTAMQIYYAIKGGLMNLFAGQDVIYVVINDVDQDTALAVWLLKNYHYFLDAAMIPNISLLLELVNKWDITAGAFPINLRDRVVRRSCWVFRAFTEARCSGALYRFASEEMEANLHETLRRIDAYMMGDGEEVDLKADYEMVARTEHCWFYKELGPDTRYSLWNAGMNAFVALLGVLPNGRKVYTAGCRSQFTGYPLPQLQKDYNAAEQAKGGDAAWGGADIVIGTRNQGSVLDFPELIERTEYRLRKVGLLS